MGVVIHRNTHVGVEITVDSMFAQGFDAVFIGSDWKGNERWQQTERDLQPLGAEVVYLQHTEGVSSSLLRDKESKKIID
jgi:hypothetical protein